MITSDAYKTMLFRDGGSISSVHKKRSNDLMNILFKNDVGYKRVYVLTQNNGWQYYDARYSKHSTVSISKDHIDYYLQFRPNISFPIGTYVFVPNEVEDNLGFSEDAPECPFKDSGFDIDRLWIIVGRDLNNQFTRYMILQCNWNFQWIYNTDYESIIANCYGCLRSASSYTSGIWVADYLTTLDQITGAWMPNLKYIYGDNLSDFGLFDNEKINYGNRFIISTNSMYPKVYMVSKVIDLNPIGLLKFTFKQDEFDENRDSSEFMLCDYYDESGKVIPANVDEINSNTDIISNFGSSEIVWRYVDENNELIENDGSQEEILSIGITSYFEAIFSDDIEDIITNWYIELIYDEDEYTDEEIAYYEGLMDLTKIDNNLVSVRPSRANSLKGKMFKLSVSDLNGNYKSSIELEVSE